MLNEHDCENCIHCPICARKEAMQGMITELETRRYFTDYDGVNRLISSVDWIRLTLTCSFFDPKNRQKL